MPGKQRIGDDWVAQCNGASEHHIYTAEILTYIFCVRVYFSGLMHDGARNCHRSYARKSGTVENKFSAALLLRVDIVR